MKAGQTNIAQVTAKSLLSVIYGLISVTCVSLSQDLKTQAKEAFEQQNYGRAVQLLERAVIERPADAEIYYLLGYYTHYYYYDSIPESSYNVAASDRILAYLKKSLQLDPNIRDAYSIMGSEYAARAINELEAGNAAGFIEYLRKGRSEGGYTDWMLEFGRNILRSCPTDAILLTGGDAEAFPVWYCRFVEQYRTDILPIPAASLGQPRFAVLLKKGVQGLFTPAPVSWNVEQLMDMSLYPWKAQTFSIPLPQKTQDAAAPQFTWTVTPNAKVSEVDMITPGKALSVDIIRTNQWQRPILFTLGCPTWIEKDLQGYLRLTGLTYQLVPLPQEPWKNVNLESIIDFFSDSTYFNAVRSWRESDIPRRSGVLREYQTIVFLTIYSLDNQGKYKEANKILDLFEKRISNGVLPMDEEYMQRFGEITSKIRAHKD
jgi:hypothetical protein